MSPRCHVIGCVNEKGAKQVGVTYHRLPKTEETRRAWLDIIGKKNMDLSTKATFVCSLHFHCTSFNKTMNIVKLRENATPSPTLLPQNRKLTVTAASSIQHNVPFAPSTEDDLVSEKTSNPQPSQGVTDLYRNFQGDDYGDDEDDDDGDRQSNHSLIDDEDETPRQTSATNTQLIHDQIHCDHCNNEVQGFRYKCLQCEDFDLCQACEAAGMHCDHYMLRIPKPRPQTELMAILQTLRAHLPPSADDEQTVPEVHNDAGPSRQKKSDTESVKKTKPNDVTNQTIESNSEPNIDCLTYPIKTEIESEIFVDGSTNFNCYDPLKTEPIPSVTDIPFVVPNTYSIPLSTVPVMPRLQIDPNSMTISSVNINTVRNEPTAVSDPSVRAELNSISVYSHNKTTFKHTSTTNTGSGDSFKPPARKRLKN